MTILCFLWYFFYNHNSTCLKFRKIFNYADIVDFIIFKLPTRQSCAWIVWCKIKIHPENEMEPYICSCKICMNISLTCLKHNICAKVSVLPNHVIRVYWIFGVFFSKLPKGFGRLKWISNRSFILVFDRMDIFTQ